MIDLAAIEEARRRIAPHIRKTPTLRYHQLKDGDAGEDEVGRAEKELDRSTGQYVSQIDELVKHKEGELLEV